jgi:cation:H+ antiporter
MDILLTLGGLIVLVVGAEIMVRGAVELALRARISPLVVGLTVVSLGTSAPELLVSLMAAMKGSSVIAIGNVVGSNISNISLVLGACILVYPIEVDRDAHRIHWPVMMLVTLLFTAMLWNDDVALWEGAILVVLLIAYIAWMVWASRRASGQPGSKPVEVTVPLWRSLLFVVLGIVGLAFGADWFVEGAVGIARTMGVSEQLIGVTIVAVGTSMPELVTSLMAAIRKQSDISIGNLVGSNIFNLLGIIGVSAIVLPIRVDHSAFLLDLGAMILIALLLYPLMRIGRRLGRWQGVLLLIAYLAYVVLVIQRG